MTEEKKTVGSTKGGLSGSLSGKKKAPTALKKAEPEAEYNAEDSIQNGKGRLSKIAAVLIEKSRQNGGRLTFGELESITQSLGMSNDAEEIEEVFSICEREGIELTNEDSDLDDVEAASENVDAELSPENTTLEQMDSLSAVESPDSAEDDTETTKTAAGADLNIPDSVGNRARAVADRRTGTRTCHAYGVTRRGRAYRGAKRTCRGKPALGRVNCQKIRRARHVVP